jgi:hypothetical protein
MYNLLILQTNTMEPVTYNLEGGALIAPRTTLGPEGRLLVKDHGHSKLKRLEVFRRPITGAVDVVINLLSRGKFDAIKRENGYDNYYHLGLLGELEDGTKFVFEKTQVVVLRAVDNFTDFESKVEVKVSPVTLQQLVDNAEHEHPIVMKTVKLGSINRKQAKAVGFYEYEAFSANCQSFVWAVLQGSGMWSEELKHFVYQPVDAIVKSLPGVIPRIAKAVTDAAAAVDIVLKGRGLKKRGTRQEVWDGEANQTSGGLTKEELAMDEGVLVSIRARKEKTTELKILNPLTGRKVTVGSRAYKSMAKEMEALKQLHLAGVTSEDMKA